MYEEGEKEDGSIYRDQNSIVTVGLVIATDLKEIERLAFALILKKG